MEHTKSVYTQLAVRERSRSSATLAGLFRKELKHGGIVEKRSFVLFATASEGVNRILKCWIQQSHSERLMRLQ